MRLNLTTRLLKPTTRTQTQTPRPFRTYTSSSFQPQPRVNMSAPGIPSTTTPLQSQSQAGNQPQTHIPVSEQNQTQTSGMSTSTATTPGTGTGTGGFGVGNGSGKGSANDPATYGITSTDLKTAPGVKLSPRQRVLVGSVLDLFKGLPTHKKMSLWTETATFSDPLTNSRGRKQYEAQWWGLKAAFSEIEQQHHLITSSSDPITLDLKTRYKVKGLGSEKVVESVVRIFTEEGGKEGEKIVGVEDRWNGRIPEGWVATALRNLNSVVVPAFVSVPKNDGEN
ncbi:hypothetical protein DL95DRAFT_387331 [Leptodontidium sp. 2 PMI_412]|nr:hypothetical protein DL95DRAFT_387331 [Leptodontidium sp. 2 PMI_412]